MSFQNINWESGGAGGGGGGGKLGVWVGRGVNMRGFRDRSLKQLKGCLLLMHTLRDYVFTQQRQATA